MTRNSTRGASPGASSSLIAPQPENAAELSDNEAVAPNEDDPHRGVLPQTAPALETATAYAPVVSRPAIKPLVTAADVSDVKKVKELQVAVMQWRSSGYPRALTDCVGNYALGVLYSTLTVAGVSMTKQQISELWLLDQEMVFRTWLQAIKRTSESSSKVGTVWYKAVEHDLNFRPIVLNFDNVHKTSQEIISFMSWFQEESNDDHYYQAACEETKPLCRAILQYIAGKVGWTKDHASAETKAYCAGLSQDINGLPKETVDSWSVARTLEEIGTMVAKVSTIARSGENYRCATNHSKPQIKSFKKGEGFGDNRIDHKRKRDQFQKAKSDSSSIQVKRDRKSLCHHCGMDNHTTSDCGLKGHPDANPDATIAFMDTIKGKKTQSKFNRPYLKAKDTLDGVIYERNTQKTNKRKSGDNYILPSVMEEQSPSSDEKLCVLEELPDGDLTNFSGTDQLEDEHLIGRPLESYETVVEVTDRSEAEINESDPFTSASLLSVIREELRIRGSIDPSITSPFEPPGDQPIARRNVRKCKRLESRLVDTDRVVFDDGSMVVQIPDHNSDISKWHSINLLFDEGSYRGNYVNRRLMPFLQVLRRKPVNIMLRGAIGGWHADITEQVEFIISVLNKKNIRNKLRIQAYVTEDISEDIIIGIAAQQTNARVRQLRAQNELIIRQCIEHELLYQAQQEWTGMMHTQALRTTSMVSGEDDSVLPSSDHIQGSDSLKLKIHKILNQFQDVFSRELRSEPAKVEPMHIEVDTEKWQVPCNSGPPRSQGRNRNLEIMKQVSKMLRAKVIKPSKASFYSQVLLIPKPNNEWRFCIDYRNLNMQTKRDRFPLPNISDILSRLGAKRAKYYAVVDMTKGFFQAPIAADSKPLTAFITQHGIYEFNRCGMGLCNSPSYFSNQMINTVLPGLVYSSCEVYLDDVIIYGATEEEFTQNLAKVLKRFREKHVTINPDKCKLGLERVEYIGHVIDQDGITFTREKLQKVVDFPKPRTQREMKSFLGLANYFRKHIANHSTIVEPLQRMTDDYKKNKPLTWSTSQEAAFATIQQRINDCPKLFFEDYNLPVHLYTDASDIGFGSYLCQVQADGTEQPIGFASKTFNKTQRRWSVYEREAYAVYEGVNHFRHLLRDVHFTIHTDHKNLTYIRDSGSAKVIRWKLELMEYNFHIDYIKGQDNDCADYLSRNDRSPLSDYDDSDDKTVGTAAEYLASITERSTIEDNSDTEHIAAQSYVTIDDKKYAEIGKHHNALVGHHGVERTLELLRNHGQDWKYMRSHVKKFIRECDCCQKNSLRDFKVGTAPFTTGGKFPFETISFDHIGPFVEDPEGNKYALVIIDIFSRFVDVYPVPDTKAETTVKALLQHMGRFGTPSHIRTDGGSDYRGHVMAQFIRELGTSHTISLADSHEENGIVERANKEINRWVRDLIYDKYKGDKQKWSVLIPYATRIHNATTIESLGCSPARIVFGISVDLDRNIFCQRVIDAKEEDQPMLDWIKNQTEAQDSLIRRAQRIQEKLHADHMGTKSDSITEYQKGSYVLLGWPVSRFNQFGRPTKWDTLYRGPYQVLGHDNQKYYLRDLVSGKEITPKSVHLLKPFHYDAARTDPKQVAMKDQPDMYLVEEILQHSGNLRTNKGKCRFKVKWLGFKEPTWEPWKHVRDNSVLHQYLQRQGLAANIPSKFR